MKGWRNLSLWSWAIVAGIGIMAQTWPMEVTFPAISALFPMEGGEAHIMRAFAVSFGVLIVCQLIAFCGQAMFVLQIPAETSLLPWQQVIRWIPFGLIVLLAAGTWRLFIFGELFSDVARLVLVAAWLISIFILAFGPKDRSAAL